MTEPRPRLYGRTGSHFTRLTRIFALEAQVPVDFEPVFDMASLDGHDYGGHPALKLPLLRWGDSQVFGAENICRRFADESPTGLRVIWPEATTTTDLRNAQELVWHAMQAQVQLVLGVHMGGLPADNPYFAKIRAGLEGTLAWLDARVDGLRDGLPPGSLSLLEASLFCLVEHLKFRITADIERFPNLLAFAADFGRRPSAAATPYVVDRPPEAASLTARS